METHRIQSAAPLEPQCALGAPSPQARRPRRRPLPALLAVVTALVICLVCIETPGVEAGFWRELDRIEDDLEDKTKSMKKYWKKVKRYHKRSERSTKAASKLERYADLLTQKMLRVKEVMFNLRSRLDRAREEADRSSGRKRRKREKKIRDAEEEIEDTKKEWRRAEEVLRDVGRDAPALDDSASDGVHGRDEYRD
ncbi:hypothetical protein BESB_075090 [Besnoitia besnoiti]|uniref:Transmembrane protein n=1 Tax=Besnoitia besnoiti TaxID=94643 RepID=A0A2A9MFG6_BESBE|nr:uncharacterized protein BESB_075090 [Besnoitia besnoiti]PFH34357.1 hypothetical protein BESB_075090 [Besnoitia besnoiti]